LGAKIIPFPIRGDVSVDISDDERDQVLIAADEMIAKGGRELLAQALKGIHSEVVLAAEGEKLRCFGSLEALTLAQIDAKIDKLLEDGLLRLEHYLGRTLLVHSPPGWERTKELLADRVFASLRKRVDGSDVRGVFAEIGRVHREVKFLVLARIEEARDARFAPLLESWRERETKPVKRRIGEVLEKTSCASPSSSPR
jgi:hypothetical protein